MKSFLFLVFFIFLLISCSVYNNSEQTREIGITKISPIQEVEGVKVVKMELLNRIGIYPEIKRRQFYVANFKIMPKEMIGQKFGKFYGERAIISYKVLCPSPLILTLTKFKKLE